jgi:D-alanine-D-alanine ligase
VFKAHEGIPEFQKIKDEIGLRFFIKRANRGSSVGVSKIHTESEYKEGVGKAFDFDRKVILEEYIQGRELECAVLGNEQPIASVPGEVISNHDFYSYDAKYIDEHGAILEIPADIPGKLTKRVQLLAIKTFQTLSCEGLGRIDFFLRDSSELIVNEINTIPGFTRISMYHRLWEASGISYPELIDKLIQLAIKRFEKEQELKTDCK